MTIAQVEPRLAFNCDGTSKVFPVALQSYLAGDFVVWHTTAAGAETQLNLGTDYTLAQVGSESPQTWVMTTTLAYPTGDFLQVIDAPAVQQQTDYNPGQAFPSAAIEQNMDRMTQMVQRVADLLSRAIVAPDGDIAPAMALPNAQARQNTNLGFGPQGQLAVNQALASGTISAASIAPFMYLILGIASPFNYGAYVGDGRTDDTATLSAFFAAANTNLSGPPNGWVNGIIPGSPLISSTLTIAGAALNVWFAGQPTAATTFSVGGTPFVNDCCFNITANDIDLYNPCFDGTIVGTTCKVNGFALNGGRIRMHEITGSHYPTYGAAITAASTGDCHIYGHQLQQFENGDVPFLIQTNFTADGIYINGPDCSVNGGYSRWNKRQIHCGSNSGTTLITNIHPYGGNSGLVTTPDPFLDPVNIQVDAGAVGIFILNCYLDNGHIDLYTHFVTIRNCIFLQNGHCNFSVDANGVPNYIRLFANGNSAAYALDIDTSNMNLAANNLPNNSNPTSPFGHLPCPSTTATTAAASATGTATINVAAWVGPQPSVGSAIVVAGITPSGFNGTVQVTASTATSVSYANSTAGPQTVAGTIQCVWDGTWSAEASLFTNTGNAIQVRGSTIKIWTRVDGVIAEEQELKSFGPITNTWQIGGGAVISLTKTATGLALNGPFGVNGATPPAQVTGFGTPVGAAVINNYNITDAGGANSNTNKMVAKIAAYLISRGDFGA